MGLGVFACSEDYWDVEAVGEAGFVVDAAACAIAAVREVCY